MQLYTDEYLHFLTMITLQKYFIERKKILEKQKFGYEVVDLSQNLLDCININDDSEKNLKSEFR